MRMGDLPSFSVNFRQQVLLTFDAAGRLSDNLRQPLCSQEKFHQLPSIFHAARKLFINLCQPTVQPDDLPSTFCVAGLTIRKLSVRSKTFHHLLTSRAARWPSISFLCGWVTFRELPLTLDAAGTPSINFRQLNVWPGDLPSTSVNFQCVWSTFRQCPSSLCVARRPSVKFCQLLRATGISSVNFPCRRKTFRQLPSTLRATGRPSVNFCQLSCGWETFCQLSVWLGELL